MKIFELTSRYAQVENSRVVGRVALEAAMPAEGGGGNRDFARQLALPSLTGRPEAATTISTCIEH